MTEKAKIIFYSESKALVENLTKIELNPIQFSGVQLISNRTILSNVLKESERIILFFVSREFDVEQRKFIRELNKNFPVLNVVLCSNAANALDAWSFDLLHFLALPILGRHLDSTLKKYLRKVDKKEEKAFKIKYHGGFYSIQPSNLLYCKGSGNYTEIFLSNQKRLTVTAQLQIIEDLLIGTTGIERIGKSFIINISGIERIVKNEVHFLGGKQLQLSPTYIRRIKKQLLGLSG